MEKTIGVIGTIVGIISSVLLAFIYLEKIHIDVGESAARDLKIQQRILYIESTRYAEVAKYYYDLRLERDLTLAEETRLRIVEKQQERISEELLDTVE